MDLHPDAMVKAINTKINLFIKRIYAYRLTLLESAACIREVLYPKLELGLVFANISVTQLSTWDAAIRRAVFRGDIGARVHTLAKPVCARGLNVLPLAEHRLLLQGTTWANALRGLKHLSSTQAALATTAVLVKSRHIQMAPRAGLEPNMLTYTHKHDSHTSQLPRIIRELDTKCNIALTTPLARPLTPDCVEAGQSVFRQGTYDNRIQGVVDCTPYSETNPHSIVEVPPPGAKNEGVIIFTDGSFRRSGDSNIERGGYGATIVPETARDNPAFLFGPDTCVDLSGGSCGAGKNYAGEGMGILAALHALPISTPATIASDSLSSVMVLSSSGKLSTSKRLKMGARPIMRTILRLLALRTALGTRTEFRHVRAHTEGKDFWSCGNARADVLADDAAEDGANIGAQSTPFLTNEERIVGFVRLKPGAHYTHIIGNIRACIRSQLEKGLAVTAGALSTQGRILHKHTTQVCNIFQSLRRKQDNTLFTFFLRAVAVSLPTPTVLSRGNRRHARLHCVLCNAREATPQHALECRGLAAQITHIQSGIKPLLHNLIAPLLEAPSLDHDHKRILSLLPASLEWYNPLTPFTPHSFHGNHWEEGEWRAALREIDEADRYTSMLGVIPPRLKKLLSPTMEECGFPESTHRAQRKERAAAWAALQWELLSGSRIIFERWRAEVRMYYKLNNIAHTSRTQGFAN